MKTFTERPCAAPGLKSYRCRSLYGWIMIGARDVLDALREARRTNQKARPEDLQEWDGQRYVARHAWTDVASPPEVSGSKFEWRHHSAPVLVKDSNGRVCVGQYAVDPDGEVPPRWIEDGRDGYEIDRPESWHMIPGDDSSCQE